MLTTRLERKNFLCGLPFYSLADRINELWHLTISFEYRKLLSWRVHQPFNCVKQIVHCSSHFAPSHQLFSLTLSRILKLETSPWALERQVFTLWRWPTPGVVRATSWPTHIGPQRPLRSEGPFKVIAGSPDPSLFTYFLKIHPCNMVPIQHFGT
jgi:hypothetical protein